MCGPWTSIPRRCAAWHATCCRSSAWELCSWIGQAYSCGHCVSEIQLAEIRGEVAHAAATAGNQQPSMQSAASASLCKDGALTIPGEVRSAGFMPMLECCCESSICRMALCTAACTSPFFLSNVRQQAVNCSGNVSRRRAWLHPRPEPALAWWYTAPPATSSVECMIRGVKKMRCTASCTTTCTSLD